MPRSFHVVELALLKVPPLVSLQEVEVVLGQAEFRTVQMSGLAVDAKTRASCGGSPIRSVKDDHGPSLPSLHSNQHQLAALDEPCTVETYKY